VFARLMIDEVRRWVRLAEDRLAGTDVRIFVMPGNDDELAIDPALESPLVINPDNEVVEIGELQMLSCSWVNPTPWNSPREEPEDVLLARLEGLADRLDVGRPTIFNLHCPPHGSTLDSAPQLTADLEIVIDGSEPRIVPVGSTAVRTLIERHQPVLSLHGHIHESRGVARIGRTTCVNPGSAYSEGVIDGALVLLEDDEVRTCQLITG
jgi:Icc-related predicted phosphoesterase